MSSPAGLSILLVPFGSEGDVRPLLWLGDALAARGHRITLILTPYYKKFVDVRPDWRWLPSGTTEQFAEAMRDPRLWEPRKGSEFVLSMMLESLPYHRDLLNGLGERFDLVIGTTLATAAFCWAEARGIPRLGVHLQPLCLRSTHECPLFMEGLEWLCRAPGFIKKATFKMMDRLLAEQLLPGLNPFRVQLGLPPLNKIYEEVWHMGDRIAGLFPPWYDTPQPDWPAQVRLFGFPYTAPTGGPKPLDPVLEIFLADGEPPILWTHGSANLDTHAFAETAIGASRELKARCLLVGPEAPPANLGLPAAGQFLYLPHAPFEQVFSRCRAVVHHGGIGTTVQAFAAGIPQLIIPRAHDQPDNARRVEKLGVGAHLSYKKMDATAAAGKLRGLLDAPAVQGACLKYRREVLGDRSLPELCAWAEELAVTGRAKKTT